jgi:hypothetical protein
VSDPAAPAPGGGRAGDWLDRYADALGVDRATEADRAALLDLARVVAHGTTRAGAPVATFLAGLAVAAGTATPAAALAAAEALLGGAPTAP